MEQWRNELYHSGIFGMKWGVRRFQNLDGSLTPAGRERYGVGESLDRVKSYLSNKKQAADEANKQRQAAEKKEAQKKLRAEKEQIIRSGNVELIKANQGKLSDAELARAISRAKLSATLSDSTKAINDGQKALNKPAPQQIQPKQNPNQNGQRQKTIWETMDDVSLKTNKVMNYIGTAGRVMSFLNSAANFGPGKFSQSTLDKMNAATKILNSVQPSQNTKAADKTPPETSKDKPPKSDKTASEASKDKPPKSDKTVSEASKDTSPKSDKTDNTNSSKSDKTEKKGFFSRKKKEDSSSESSTAEEPKKEKTGLFGRKSKPQNNDSDSKQSADTRPKEKDKSFDDLGERSEHQAKVAKESYDAYSKFESLRYKLNTTPSSDPEYPKLVKQVNEALDDWQKALNQ